MGISENIRYGHERMQRIFALIFFHSKSISGFNNLSIITFKIATFKNNLAICTLPQTISLARCSAFRLCGLLQRVMWPETWRTCEGYSYIKVQVHLLLNPITPHPLHHVSAA